MDKRERKKIKFTVDGVDYTLEYTVASVRKMERDGFNFNKMEDNIVNAPYDLFSGAFIARHNYVPATERDRLYELLVNENEEGQNLVECLADMLSDELDWIVSKPSGNVTWAMA